MSISPPFLLHSIVIDRFNTHHCHGYIHCFSLSHVLITYTYTSPLLTHHILSLEYICHHFINHSLGLFVFSRAFIYTHTSSPLSPLMNTIIIFKSPVEGIFLFSHAKMCVQKLLWKHSFHKKPHCGSTGQPSFPLFPSLYQSFSFLSFSLTHTRAQGTIQGNMLSYSRFLLSFSSSLLFILFFSIMPFSFLDLIFSFFLSSLSFQIFLRETELIRAYYFLFSYITHEFHFILFSLSSACYHKSSHISSLTVIFLFYFLLLTTATLSYLSHFRLQLPSLLLLFLPFIFFSRLS